MFSALRVGRSSTARAGSRKLWTALGLAAAVAALACVAEPALAQFPPVVRGSVLEADTRTPVPGAVVRIDGSPLRTATDARGTFVLRGLLPGEHTLRVEALGYLPESLQVEAANGRVESLQVLLTPAPLELEGVEALESSRDLPPEARVVGLREIRDSGAGDLGELLAGEAGVTVTRRGGPGAPTTLSLRGSSADEVLVLRDGVPLNSPLTGEVDVSTVSLDGIGRVVILPGGRSARHGGGALAGVVSLETRTPEAREVSARSRVGAWGERGAAATVGGVGGAGGDGPKLAGRLQGSWREFDGDFEYPVPAVRGGGRARRSNADSRRLSLGADGRLALSGTVARARVGVVKLERGMPGSVVSLSPTARQDQRRWTAMAAVEADGSAMPWRVSADAQRQTAAFHDPSPPAGPPLATETRVDALGAEGLTSKGLTWKGLGSTELVLGAEVRSFRVRSDALTRDAPNTITTGGVWGGATLRYPLTRGLELAVGGQLRSDWHTLLDGSAYSPRVSLSLAGEHASARISAGRSFSPPSLADQFFQEGVLVEPNPDLEPERVRGEVEASFDVRGRWLGTSVEGGVSAFTADVDGMIIWFPDHRFVWSPANFDVERKGIELRGELRRSYLELRADVAHHRVEYDGRTLSGQVIYRPRTTARVSARLRPGPWRVSADGRRTGRRRTVVGSSLNVLEAYWSVDVAVGRDLEVGPSRIAVDLEATNVLDADGAMLVDYPVPGRGWLLRVRVDPFGARSPESFP